MLVDRMAVPIVALETESGIEAKHRVKYAEWCSLYDQYLTIIRQPSHLTNHTTALRLLWPNLVTSGVATSSMMELQGWIDYCTQYGSSNPSANRLGRSFIYR
jgi:hypothetical protein